MQTNLYLLVARIETACASFCKAADCEDFSPSSKRHPPTMSTARRRSHATHAKGSVPASWLSTWPGTRAACKIASAS
jgi:hypothetical protein